jgi:hypothetical protein
MVRFFLLAENTIASVGTKVLCGATYLDGVVPARLLPLKSMQGATQAMRTHGRTRPRHYLKWSNSKDIRDNLSMTLDLHDPLFTTVLRHASTLTEWRYVRNHIAHRNHGTRKDFQSVVRNYYGGLKQGVTPGLLLLTDAFGMPCLLERYIISSRVVVKDLVRA